MPTTLTSAPPFFSSSTTIITSSNSNFNSATSNYNSGNATSGYTTPCHCSINNNDNDNTPYGHASRHCHRPIDKPHNPFLPSTTTTTNNKPYKLISTFNNIKPYHQSSSSHHRPNLLPQHPNRSLVQLQLFLNLFRRNTRREAKEEAQVEGLLRETNEGGDPEAGGAAEEVLGSHREKGARQNGEGRGVEGARDAKDQ